MSGGFFGYGHGFQISDRAPDQRVGRKIFLRHVAVPNHRVESLLRQISIPVRIVTSLQPLIEGACLGEFAGAFAVARRPVGRFAAKIRVAIGVICEMLCQHS